MSSDESLWGDMDAAGPGPGWIRTAVPRQGGGPTFSIRACSPGGLPPSRALSPRVLGGLLSAPPASPHSSGQQDQKTLNEKIK